MLQHIPPRHYLLFVLVLFCFNTALPTWAASDPNDPAPIVTRRSSESEASYQARGRAAERALATASKVTDGTPPLVERRRGESEASYQARSRAAERARRSTMPQNSLQEHPNETAEQYIARLRLTIKGLLLLQKTETPLIKVTKRRGESEASYQARVRAAMRARQAHTQSLSSSPLIARPGEDSALYIARMVEKKNEAQKAKPVPPKDKP